MPARILVAEDDRKQAELIRRYLEREGHLTVVVHDGRAAIDEARERGIGHAMHHAQLDVAHWNVLDSARAGLTTMEHWYGLPEAMFTDRAIVYRVNNGFDHFKVALSVGVATEPPHTVLSPAETLDGFGQLSPPPHSAANAAPAPPPWRAGQARPPTRRGVEPRAASGLWGPGSERKALV